MERSHRIQQIYGYLVCIIAIITMLISGFALINGFLDRMRPEGVGRYSYGTEQTFEEYRLSQKERIAKIREGTDSTMTVPSDSALRVAYDENKARDKVSEDWHAFKSIISNTFLFAIALILFIIHWRWLRGLNQREHNV